MTERASATAISSGSSRWCQGDGRFYWHRLMDAAWLDRVELEHDNIRAAFAHAEASGDAEQELRLAVAMRYFWRVRGLCRGSRRRLERGVELSPGLDGRSSSARGPSARPGVMAFVGRRPGALPRALARGAAVVRDESGNRREMGARAQLEIGASWHAEDELPRALEHYEAARAAFIAPVDDPNAMGVILANLGAVYHALGDLDAADPGDDRGARARRGVRRRGRHRDLESSTSRRSTSRAATSPRPPSTRSPRSTMPVRLSYREVTA